MLVKGATGIGLVPHKLSCLLYIMYGFDRCHSNQAVMKPVKYKYDPNHIKFCYKICYQNQINS